MGKRIFMDVSQVFAIADKLSNYSDTQTSMIDKYHLTAIKMIDSMEGATKNSLETAANHIKAETCDAIGRMTGFNLIYKITGNNRLLIDKEGAEAAKIKTLQNRTELSASRDNSYRYNNMTSQYTSSLGLFDDFTEMNFLKTGNVNKNSSDFVSQKTTNDALVKLLQYYAEQNDMDPYMIEYHRTHNVDKLKDVYVSGKYIENQSFWGEVRYGTSGMDNNGCGIIAIINACHSLGMDMTNEEVADLIAEFEANGCVWGGMFGTSPLAIVEYFENSPYYEVTYTTSAEIEENLYCDETFIVEVYNKGNDITSGMHYVNIERRVDENGDVKYVVHNSGYYSDDNKNNSPDKDEFVEMEYDSLDEAIENVGHDHDSEPVMIIKITKPEYNDAPEKEEKPC